MWRAGVLTLGVMLAVSACGTLPSREPRGECREALDPNVDVLWAGRGRLVDLGLMERDVAGPGAGVGDVWVGVSSGELYLPPGVRMWCALFEGPDGTASNGGEVPEGWQPP